MIFFGGRRLVLLAAVTIAGVLECYYVLFGAREMPGSIATHDDEILSSLRPQGHEALQNVSTEAGMGSSEPSDAKPVVRPNSPLDKDEQLDNDSASRSTKLRLDWSNLTLTSPTAKWIEAFMSNCSLPLGTFPLGNKNGLGSHLHVWSMVLCNGMEQGRRIWSPPPFLWNDESVCGALVSAYDCYFPSAELLCEGDQKNDTVSWLPIKWRGNACNYSSGEMLPLFRAATTEYMFRNVSDVVIKEAERQVNLVFGPRGVPDNLITVHIRWGDKKAEMELVPIVDYMKAIHDIVEARGTNQNVSIFLATEDPKAVKAFQEAAPKEWTIYLDQYYRDLLPYRQKEDVYNQNPMTAKETKGRAGLVALGSLLLSMEANDYVLTTSSNWSRLMNELRKNVLDPRCNNCTRMIDLRYMEQ